MSEEKHDFDEIPELPELEELPELDELPELAELPELSELPNVLNKVLFLVVGFLVATFIHRIVLKGKRLW